MPSVKPHHHVCLALITAFSGLSPAGRAEYSYFSDVPSGSDIVMKEVRWPYWNNTYYNTWWSDYWTSQEGTSGYFYNGLALPAAGSPNPVGTRQTVNFSFWPLSNPVHITDTIGSAYTSPETFAMPTIGEGTLFRSPGLWSLWQTNVWYRMVIRTWQPTDGTPHLGYAGTWLRDPVAGVWHHMATVQLPFAVTGIDGSMSFQENASGGSQPQRTDYRRSYYHKNGVWASSTNWYAYDHGGAIENAGLIETNTAVYYETCQSNGVYTGTITPANPTSPTYHLTQAPAPTFDPILVSNCSAVVYGSQLLVQWQTLPASSPQFAYQIEVYTNNNGTGPTAATVYAIAPEAQQQLLTVGSVAASYVRLTIIDVFNQTNAPIGMVPAGAALSAATAVPGAVNGLAYAYYESPTDYTSDADTNWAALPDLASLAPVASGTVSGLDLTPRHRREGYAFNYSGYLDVPADGIYAFTLNSCDGSRLYVDGELVVNWDGDHSASDRTGWLGLAAGSHTLKAQYFFDVQPSSLFNDYFDTLTLSYEGPGLAKTVVPATAFYRVPAPSEPSVTLSTPADGATLAGASVPLAATVTTNGAAANQVQFYVGNYYWARAAQAPYSQSAFLWANASNAVRARLLFSGSNSIDSASHQVTTTNMALNPWQSAQIFYHNQPNGAANQEGMVSLIGDGMNLLTRQVNGDCTLVARLAGITSSGLAPDGSSANTGWQAGIILRGTTNMTPGYPWGETGTAPFTAVFGQVDGGAYCQDQTMVNGGGGYSSYVGGQKWFKIQRAGSVFTSSVSADGNTWTGVLTNTLTGFGTTLYAGFFTYAGPSSNPNVHWASFDQISLTGNVIGPPGVAVNPSAGTAYAGQNITFTALPTGNPPFACQWQQNGATIAEATNATLSLTNVQPAASGQYTVRLSNSNGTASATATLAVLTPPTPVAAVLSAAPAGYWRLNETTGPTACDELGHFSGSGEGNVVFGVPGVTPPPFTAFEAGNLAAQFNGLDADISIPPFNVTTTNFSITGWVKCNGPQTSWSGLVFSRGSGHGTGLMAANNGGNLELRYSWNDDGNDYNFSTGLNLPTNGLWAFVGLTIEPTRAIVFLATNSVLAAATNNVANSGRSFAGNFYFGYDPNSNSRRINGVLDEIAVYNHTLTPAQMGAILSASVSAAPPAVNLTAPASGASLTTPGTINLMATVAPNGHTIDAVRFYDGPTLLGQAAAPPYGCSWTTAPLGPGAVFAEVIYDGGSVLTSVPAFITVNQAAPGGPRISSAAFAAGAFSLRASGSAGESCVLLGTTNLAPPVAWEPVQTNTADTNGAFNFSDGQAPDFTQRFYRLQAQ